jgi:hypothetical protein
VRNLHDVLKEAMNVPLLLKTLETMIIDPCYMSSNDYNQYMCESYHIFREALRKVGLEKKK